MTADIVLLPLACGAAGICAVSAIKRKLPELLYEACDIESALLTEDVIKSFRGKLDENISYILSEEESPLLSELSDALTDENSRRAAIESAVEEIGALISERLSREELQDTLSTEAAAAVREKLKNSFFGSIVSDRLIAGMVKPVGAGICRYLAEHTGEAVREDVRSFIENKSELRTSEVCSLLGIDKEHIENKAESFYRKAVKEEFSERLSGELKESFRKKSLEALYLRAGGAGVLVGLFVAALEYLLMFLYF